MEEEYEYFRSELDKLCFLLIEMEGKKRNDHLGIKRIHYVSKKHAKKWYKGIAFKIHPDRNPDHPKCKEALAELNEIYQHMTL